MQTVGILCLATMSFLFVEQDSQGGAPLSRLSRVCIMWSFLLACVCMRGYVVCIEFLYVSSYKTVSNNSFRCS